ncbi:MAG: Rne/Rng family ribonuclease [candidate division WOR-3 bacterium]
MSKKDIILNITHTETRIAVVDDGVLSDFYVSRPGLTGIIGNIYKGRVENVVPGLKAAFVNINMEKNAFLPISEIPFEEFSELLEDEVEIEEKESKRPSEILLKEGQEILVQVTKESYGGKGPRITSYLSIPGRYVVLLVNASNVGISRKIRDRKGRDRLRDIAQHYRPEGVGLIVRTAASYALEEEIAEDIRLLYETWLEIKRQAEKKSSPALLYEEPDIIIRLVRDLFTTDVRNLIVDSKDEYDRIINYLTRIAPRLRSRVKFFNGPIPIFRYYGIEEQISKTLDRKVWLESGGYITIDQTEALIAIDINTGKFSKEKNPEKLALQTNIEAVKEIARQLRLRDIGGLVVIDLIDMGKKELFDRVLHELHSALRGDRARYRIGGVSEFGLLELTRERSRLSLLHTFTEACPQCNGTGRVISKASIAGDVVRWLENFEEKLKGRIVEVRVSPSMADYLSVERFDTLCEVSRKSGFVLRIRGDYSIPEKEFKIFFLDPEEEITHKFESEI